MTLKAGLTTDKNNTTGNITTHSFDPLRPNGDLTDLKAVSRLYIVKGNTTVETGYSRTPVELQ